jgi:hypothetical protein
MKMKMLFIFAMIVFFNPRFSYAGIKEVGNAGKSGHGSTRSLLS